MKPKVSIETLAEWWANTNAWEPPFHSPGITWDRESIWGAFHILSAIVPQTLALEAWQKRQEQKERDAA